MYYSKYHEVNKRCRFSTEHVPNTDIRCTDEAAGAKWWRRYSAQSFLHEFVSTNFRIVQVYRKEHSAHGNYHNLI